MSDLTLYAEAGWVSPWVFHAMVALEEKRLPYRLEVVTLPPSPERRATLQARAVIGKVPILVDGEAWISESIAISEYLAESYPTPGHPRIFPADLADRARARQVLSFLRTDLHALREDRPTSTVFGTATTRPFSPTGREQAAELVRIASALIAPGQPAMFGDFCIADADLALALMRLVANRDPVPPALAAYAAGVWARPSAQVFVQHARAAVR